MTNKKSIISLVLISLSSLTRIANADPDVQDLYFCINEHEADVEVRVAEEQEGVFYLTPYQIRPVLKQDPVQYRTFKTSKSWSGESGRLSAVKNGDEASGTNVLGILSSYSFFFNKRGNYMSVKNKKGKTFVCSDNPNDSWISIRNDQ